MKIKNGTIYNVGSKDYIYNGYKRIDAPDYTYDDTRIAYWQSEINKYSCSLHATMTVISNNFYHFFNLRERNDILQLAISRGFDPIFGWYMDKSVKCVVDYCNDYLGFNLNYIRVPADKIQGLCNLGFGVVSGYQSKKGMFQDKIDGVLGDDIETYGDNKYGHLISLWDYKKNKDPRKNTGVTKGLKCFGLVDQYYGKSDYNETFISNYDKLIEKNIFFPSGYIIVDKIQAKPKTMLAYKQKLRDFRKLINT